MSRPFPVSGVVLTLAVLLATGCRPQQPFYFGEDGDLSHYLDMATEIEYPDAEVATLEEVEGTEPPLSLRNSNPREIVDLTLEEAIRTALANSKVIRLIGGTNNLAAFAATPPDFLMRSPATAPTIWDPAIVETNPRFGVEAALSAFDAQVSASMFWEKIDQPLNVNPDFFGGGLFAPVSIADNATFQAQLSKYTRDGSQFSLTHSVDYIQNLTDPRRRFDSVYNGRLVAGFRKPLLRGSGAQVIGIQGPGAIPGFNNGVMIARIQTDKSLAEFEGNVRDMVRDVENAYWLLYLAYRQLDAVIAGRDSALATWRKTYARFTARTGTAVDEALAREQYYLFRGSMEDALNRLYVAESKLRYLMGLAAADGRLFRPADEPTTAWVPFQWNVALSESLTRSVELRQQRWDVKQRQLELISATNYLLPQLDAVGEYRFLGMGDNLIAPNDKEGVPFRSMYETMTGGDYTEWQLGLQLSFPIGNRKEHAGVVFARHQLAKSREVLREIEFELSHQLAFALRDMAAQHKLAQTAFNRRVAAQKQVEAVEATVKAGKETVDILLDAQRRLATAESEYYQALVSYNLAMLDVHYRKGSLLEYNGVYLAEGPWPQKAYFDALRRARARDAALYMNYGFTRPKVLSRGPYQQHPGGSQLFRTPEDLKRAEEDLEKAEVVPRPDPLSAPGMEVPGEPPAPPDPMSELDESAFDMRPHEQSTPLGRPVAEASATDRLSPQAPPVRPVSELNFRQTQAGRSPGTWQSSPSASPVRQVAYYEPVAATPQRPANTACAGGTCSLAPANSSPESAPSRTVSGLSSPAPNWRPTAR